MIDQRNPTPSVRKLRMPVRETAIASWYPGADLLDAYAVTIDRPVAATMHALVAPTLASPPPWLRGLLGLRDALVRPFGVRTTTAMRDAAGPHRHIDFFRIRSETPDEIVLGDDDRHLDFRVSFLKRSGPHGTEVVATTAVHVNNAFGRVYITLIAPFHHMVVRTSLMRLAAAMASGRTTS
ncbi:DUF2867 domain-containing protein [Sphingomonas sp. A2-49]|uniref:DUF2867 domain-containing protein n=1 Tax=Sphingomonas sp. A2-49 TaxID=1391375 RepID=UPI0021D248BE|nr:DUF2867 domain-containing protein [Sphingomonas sp. A2-49]MCU6453907.1 DUF2867 domain-containing protein [Sphingomonas sp. A2-49]